MSTAQKEASKRASKRIKKLKDDKKIASTKDQADILGERFDKKFMKLAESKEAQLRAKDFDAGLKRAEDRAIKETMQLRSHAVIRATTKMFRSNMAREYQTK